MKNRFENCIDLGLMDYSEVLRKQLEWHARVKSEELDSALIVVEHPAVFTLGKSASLEHVLATGTHVQVIQTDRGGEVTAHAPGQIVVYPIVPIQRWKLSPKRYVELLEESVIQLLREYDVLAKRDEVNPGVWVEDKKVCALGIRIKDRVSMHGMALNVNCDLNLFSMINPCGIVDRGVTRLCDLTDQLVEIKKVKNLWIKHIRSIFSSES